jgi:hypothetical protein
MVRCAACKIVQLQYSAVPYRYTGIVAVSMTSREERYCRHPQGGSINIGRPVGEQIVELWGETDFMGLVNQLKG